MESRAIHSARTGRRCQLLRPDSVNEGGKRAFTARGNLLSCPQNEMGGEEEGEKKEKEWTGGETDPDIHPRGMYIKPTGTIATEE